MNDSSIQFKIAIGLLRYLGFLIAITMYQAGTAIMARKKGDISTLTQERASLNPVAHIDPMGTVIFPIFTIMLNFPIVFGWPKFHMVETRYFKKMKRDINVVYLTGVAINFLISILCMIALRFLGGGLLVFSPATDFSNSTILIKTMLGIVGLTNITIGALFLLPFPGTAGWNILLNNVSYNTAQQLQDKTMIITFIALALLLVGVFNLYFNIFITLFMYGSNTFFGL
jgi:Zn-dependent protease